MFSVALLMTTIQGGSDATNVLKTSIVVQQMAQQAGLIRQRIIACGTDNPSGNNGTTFRVIYPGAATAASVSALICPGNATNIWSQSDGAVVPVPLAGFNAWQYINDASSMRITVTSTVADRTTILPSLANSLGTQASYSGNTLTWVLAN